MNQNIVMTQRNYLLMKDETGDVAIKEFAELKPKIYQFLIDENSEHKNQRVFEKMLKK